MRDDALGAANELGSRNEYVVFAPGAELAAGPVGEVLAGLGVALRTAPSEEAVVQAALLPRTRCVALVDGPAFDAVLACRRLRFAKVLVPIIALVGDVDVRQEPLLAAGADQVLSTGDVPRIALQLRAVFRRARGRSGLVRCGDLRLDQERRRATLAGVWLDVSPSEFDLLYLMCSHAGIELRVEDLGLELLGRIPSRPDRKALVQRVTRLRQKLGPFGKLIESRQGGYVLRLPDVRERRTSEIEELRPTRGRARKSR